MSTKQKLLSMGLNVWGLDLFVESFLASTKLLISKAGGFTLDQTKLNFELNVRDRGDRNGRVKITIERLEDSTDG